MDIRFLIQLTDGGGGDLDAPEGLSNVLHMPDGYAGQVHLNQSLFHTALPAAIPLNDGTLRGDSLELGYLEGDISGSGGEVVVVVSTVVAQALLVTLVPGAWVNFSASASSSLLDVSPPSQCFPCQVSKGDYYECVSVDKELSRIYTKFIIII